jgi:hypothetical protein
MLEGRTSDCHALATTVILMRLVEELALLSERTRNSALPVPMDNRITAH